MAVTAPPASPRAGRYLLAEDGPEGFWAFHPAQLPPQPPLVMDVDLQTLSDPNAGVLQDGEVHPFL